MLDKYITPVIKPVLTPVVKFLAAREVTADQLTLAGFVIGLLALPLLAFELWYLALAVIIINRIVDGLDGALARYNEQSSSAGGLFRYHLRLFILCCDPPWFYFGEP